MWRRSIFLSSLVLVLGLVVYASGGNIATNPSPADGAKCVDPNTVLLTWSPGDFADSHDVYFGTNFNDVSNATIGSGMGVYQGRQVSNTYTPGGLEAICKTYYWRIDEVNEPNIWKGTVWNFTTSGPNCCHCVDPPPDMVAWWPLDEKSGNTSEDIAKDNDGTWVGSPTPLLGEYVKNSLDFNSSTDYVQVPNDESLNFDTNDFSIDAWVRTSTTSGNRVIVDKRGGDISNPIGYAFYLFGGRLALQLGDSIGGRRDFISFFLSIEPGQWNHVAVTVDRDEPNIGLVFYVNGVNEMADPTTNQGSLNNDANLLIGHDRFVSSYYFDGEIDEVELFNRELGADEIGAIYAAASEGKCKCDPAPSYRDDIKWSQPPEVNDRGCINGWDEVSIIDSNSNCWNCSTQPHGDADCDGGVGLSDSTILAAAMNTIRGNPNYNPCADFNRDGKVNVQDQYIMATWWGGDIPEDGPLARAIVADDWVCMDDRPIKDIHWWGSFKGWTQNVPPNDEPNAFRLGIWTDVPALYQGGDPNDPNTFSHPGRLVWEKVCSCYTWSFAGCDIDPRGIEKDETCFMFDQLLSQDEWFYQETNEPNGTVYWLSIAAIYDSCTPEPNYPWGWKTRPHFYNDDAVRIADVNGSLWPPVIGSTWVSGEPIEYPAGTSWDLAFVLTTNRMYTPRRGYWPQPPEPPIPDVNTVPLPHLDFNDDLIINFKDFAAMADVWLTEGEVWPEWDMP